MSDVYFNRLLHSIKVIHRIVPALLNISSIVRTHDIVLRGQAY